MLTMLKRKALWYNLIFTLKAVKCAKESTKEAAAHEFKVNPRRIRAWCLQKEKLVDLKSKENHVVALTTLSFEKYHHSFAIDLILIRFFN